MRSQVLRQSRTLLKSSSQPTPLVSHSLRFAKSSSRSTQCPSGKRFLSTSESNGHLASGAPPEDTSDGSLTPSAEPPEPPLDEPEKPKTRRARISTAVKESISVELPEDLNILWAPDTVHAESDTSYPSALPPPGILEEALHNLHIALHPQTQQRATYASASGALSEPTIALYCPIEGGDYIIDATVRELARRTDSEVVVLDAVQLAAGEWGQFGKANSLQLTRNPLHFPSSPSAPRSNPRSSMADDEDESSPSSQSLSPSQLTLTVMAPSAIRGRTLVASSPSRSVPPSKIRLFFDALVNIPNQPMAEGTVPSELPPSTPRKPRLIYVRDFPTLAPSSSSWYPPLLSAVRQRRRGPISRPTSPIANPTTIIFGITPSITPSSSSSSSQNSSGSNIGLMNFLMNRNSNPAFPFSSSKSGKSEWGEDEVAEKARERRLRDRLKKWEKGDDTLHDDLPPLAPAKDGDNSNGTSPEIVMIGGSGGIPLPSFLAPALSGQASDSPAATDNDSQFFRTSVLVPRARSLAKERDCRISRRREINELTMRMGIGAIGGILQKRDVLGAILAASKDENEENSQPQETTEASVAAEGRRMWEEWGRQVEVWTNVRQIADRAVGTVVATTISATRPEKATLVSTDIPWSVVYRAWTTHRSNRELRKAWMKDSSGLSVKSTREHDEVDEDEEHSLQNAVDEVVERVRQDPDLDSHEQRLLPCIIDAASMPTSFNEVHLPVHTIDAVRTIVSLPLIHPMAFQSGILKEHGMTGCLLFGPPGTGKTLVVRALAKEAGCRMMAISPSDVMDMYVGEGEKLVKAVFSLARRLSPCVVFLDEIDALFGARMSARESGGAFAHRGVITEFMQEMDGLKSSKEDNVIVIGATNRPFDLDDAVLRRLPRRLLVDLPGEKEREEILKILLRDETLDADLSIKSLAKTTESFSGSDLKHLCVAAALDAVKERVHVPWSPNSAVNSASPESDAFMTESVEASTPKPSPGDSPASTAESPLTVTSSPPASTTTVLEAEAETVEPAPYSRVLHLRNFTKALKEITPSSSERLGSLADLRKWNEEFGEGRKDRKRQQVWGKGRFGFAHKINEELGEGRVTNDKSS